MYKKRKIIVRVIVGVLIASTLLSTVAYSLATVF